MDDRDGQGTQSVKGELVGCLGYLSYLGFIVLVVAAWAICFGVTYNGKHYSLSCEHGVDLGRPVKRGR